MGTEAPNHDSGDSRDSLLTPLLPPSGRHEAPGPSRPLVPRGASSSTPARHLFNRPLPLPSHAVRLPLPRGASSSAPASRLLIRPLLAHPLSRRASSSAPATYLPPSPRLDHHFYSVGHGNSAPSSNATAVDVPSTSRGQLSTHTARHLTEEMPHHSGQETSNPGEIPVISDVQGTPGNTVVDHTLTSNEAVDGTAANPNPPSFNRHLIVILLLLIGYIIVAIIFYLPLRDKYNDYGIQTNGFVDGIYFGAVTLSTVGYGDIVPRTPFTKVLVCVLCLLGVALMIGLNVGFNQLLCYCDKLIVKKLHDPSRDHFCGCVVDHNNLSVRTGVKVGIALIAMFFCIVGGAVLIQTVEKEQKLTFLESMYMSIVSTCSVGYGDHSFKSLNGRLSGSAWLVLSILITGKGISYIVELMTGQH